jgi:hypothetical protein
MGLTLLSGIFDARFGPIFVKKSLKFWAINVGSFIVLPLFLVVFVRSFRIFHVSFKSHLAAYLLTKPSSPSLNTATHFLWKWACTCTERLPASDIHDVIFVPRAFRSTAPYEVISVGACLRIDQKPLKSLEVKAKYFSSKAFQVNVNFDKYK